MSHIRSNAVMLKQICQHIPPRLVARAAREHGVDRKSRSFSPWSHVVAMVYAQLAHALSLNDLCDALRNRGEAPHTVRGATPPSRNGLSHANRTRDSAMAEQVFWDVLGWMRERASGFGMGRKYAGIPRRFKRAINSIDSTTIALVANCMDWAKHRRRKAAAKCHMRLNPQEFLPRFVAIGSGNVADVSRVAEPCAGLRAGEIVVFDKAYLLFSPLAALTARGVFWISRAKTDMRYEKTTVRWCSKSGPVILDAIVRLTGYPTKKHYPQSLRLIKAWVEVEGKPKLMTFLTNNMEWAPTSICDLYKSRWGIETFFKELKQNLQPCDFLGYSANAIEWQLWMALLSYVLVRFLAHLSQWGHSFSRIFTTPRALLWARFDLMPLLESYGTAHGLPRTRAAPEHAYLPGLAY